MLGASRITPMKKRMQSPAFRQRLKKKRRYARENVEYQMDRNSNASERQTIDKGHRRLNSSGCQMHNKKSTEAMCRALHEDSARMARKTFSMSP
ncbi:unnamed protein product [Angiostrongylus costaricensis]|uniref:POP1 domain-containing protein n=1 Tax=Angiostrongylus costaricensis TaxID=334426 RepID=A0A0R3PZ28_ANGCS|nr:unnamed protein product [Angiostrongylus costaricensis]